MKIELTCQNSTTGQLFDLTSLEGNIQYFTTLSSQASKLTFNLEDDPNKLEPLSEGSIIRLKVDGKNIFYGYLFTMGVDMTGQWKLTAYDQIRYFQNSDTVFTEKRSASAEFGRLCNNMAIKHRIETPTAFVVPERLHSNKTYFSIVEYLIQKTNIATGKYYFIYDDFGTLVFSELQQYKTNLIIGDNSLLTGYQYETSIDKDTANTVKIIRDNEETGKRDVWIQFDSSTQKKWGKLQILQTADKNANDAQIKQLADNLLRLKNRPTRTMKISAIGTQITINNSQQIIDAKSLIAGAGFKLKIDKLNILQDMWIMSATHSYNKDLHTLSLEVFI